MQNAHLRIGRLEYIKPATSAKSAGTHISVLLDRVILEPAEDPSHAPRCHLVSLFAGEQEIAAMHAAIADQATFRITLPGGAEWTASVGERAHVLRGSIQTPGRKQPVRHLVALSQELFETQAGGHPGADRTVVYSNEPEFLAYRLGVRFGIPLLPCWSNWIASELETRNLLQEMPGLGCQPVLVKATKQTLLDLMAGALKTGVLEIPAEPKLDWNIKESFTTPI